MTGALIDPAFRPAWPGLEPLRAWARRHPVSTDLVLAFGVLGLALVVGAQAPGPDRRFLAGIVVVLLTALALRRRFPLTALAVTAALSLALGLLGTSFPPTTVAVLVAVYTVAAYRDRYRVAAAAGTVVALAAADLGGDIGLAVFVAHLVFATALVTAAFALGVTVRTRRAYLASLHDRAVRAERERDQESQIAAARERARIAREMHDIIAHNLSVMIALADGAAFAARTDAGQAEAAAKHVSATGRQALDEMHRLLSVLRGTGEDSPRAPQPGIADIDELVDQVRVTGLPATWTVTGRRFPLPPTVELAVYRVAQEALTNVLKHAVAPTSAKIHLTYEDPLVTLEVLDDGRPAPVPVTSDGHGLGGMRERASITGGVVDAGPRAGGGWLVRGRFGVRS
ncbi:two-component sensor histidine kinase [Amycolatopsis balhimycina DSM 5908]|uniref:histidine kinase n=1 Tax=Amycolatopsis balhimycina DSM 5908 TaxID=1081091 RepID=A0A428WMT3_AMYBA|nr:histidine kinase [Amycolatopsis balhimycina]RSM44385.1 two-component sensor histidine kinase [Amycolatopsis balhimycina DSM 5908]